MSDKISLEMAEQEFERFADSMDIDIDTDSLNEEDVASFNEVRKKFIKALQKGSLVVNDEGEAVFTTTRGEPISLRFREPDGAALQAVDKRKKNEDVAKLYSIMGAISGKPPKTFANMKMADLKVCQAITTLLMG